MWWWGTRRCASPPCPQLHPRLPGQREQPLQAGEEVHQARPTELLADADVVESLQADPGGRLGELPALHPWPERRDLVPQPLPERRVEESVHLAVQPTQRLQRRNVLQAAQILHKLVLQRSSQLGEVAAGFVVDLEEEQSGPPVSP